MSKVTPTEVRTYEPTPGSQIDSVAGVLAIRAYRDDVRWQADFNDVTIYADPGETSAKVVKRFWRRTRLDREAYARTPEAKRQRRIWALKRAEVHLRSKELLKRADTLDFTDYGAVIRLIRDCVDPMGYAWTGGYGKGLAVRLKAHGYEPGVNTGDDFRKDDFDNSARWLIGQAIDMLQTGAGMHGVTTKFCDQWLEQWGYTEVGA